MFCWMFLPVKYLYKKYTDHHIRFSFLFIIRHHFMSKPRWSAVKYKILLEVTGSWKKAATCLPRHCLISSVLHPGRLEDYILGWFGNASVSQDDLAGITGEGEVWGFLLQLQVLVKTILQSRPTSEELMILILCKCFAKNNKNKSSQKAAVL